MVARVNLDFFVFFGSSVVELVKSKVFSCFRSSSSQCGPRPGKASEASKAKEKKHALVEGIMTNQLSSVTKGAIITKKIK